MIKKLLCKIFGHQYLYRDVVGDCRRCKEKVDIKKAIEEINIARRKRWDKLRREILKNSF